MFLHPRTGQASFRGGIRQPYAIQSESTQMYLPALQRIALGEMLDLITLTGVAVRAGTYVFFLGLIRAYKCTPRNQPYMGLMRSMVVSYCLTPKNKRPRFAISTASSSSLPSPAVHRSSGPMVSEVFPLRNAASNADLRALSDAIRRGSE